MKFDANKSQKNKVEIISTARTLWCTGQANTNVAAKVKHVKA